MNRRIFIYLCIGFLPVLTYAQGAPNVGPEPTALDTLIYKINALIINPAIATLFIIAFVIFLYGLVEFLRKANNKDGRAVGKQHMIWGIIGFVIMLGVYGIINILLRTFNIEGPVVNPKEQKFIAPSVPDIKIK
jgi:Na+/proline symporter